MTQIFLAGAVLVEHRRAWRFAGAPKRDTFFAMAESMASDGVARSELQWVMDRCSAEGAITGFDPTGWEDSIWVLHAMYEHVDQSINATHDDVHQRLLERGDIEPLVVCDVNLEEGTTSTGVSLGMTSRPGPDWERLRWMELADRLSLTYGDEKWPPSSRWFPYRSWPATIEPPCEGSLDEKSLADLVAVLGAAERTDESPTCWVHNAHLMTGDFDKESVGREILARVPHRLYGDSDQKFSPTNFWPHDRSWFVYTDWDLSATKVSGPNELISMLESHPTLETIRWSTPTKGTALSRRFRSKFRG